VIDEQHRFAVVKTVKIMEELNLTSKDTPPHVLVMTATPSANIGDEFMAI
jgi:RecG-like helicase